MIHINSVSIASNALNMLRRQKAKFKPREPGDVLALVFMSGFVNADGTVVAGFRPGYMPDSASPIGRNDMWALVQVPGAPEFLFMPRFRWSADELYVIDIVSEQYELLSIGPKTG